MGDGYAHPFPMSGAWSGCACTAFGSHCECVRMAWGQCSRLSFQYDSFIYNTLPVIRRTETIMANVFAPRPSLVLRVLAAVGLAFASATALGQTGTYPDRPVTIVSGFAVGGSLDLTARLLAKELAQRLGQNFVVDVKAGAGGAIAAANVAKSSPDGYTLLLGFDGTLAISPNLVAKPAYDPIKDFESISKLVDVPLMVSAHPSLAARTIGELVALSVKKPNSLSYASSGLGTTPHLGGELLRARAGMDWTHVPYKGGGQSVSDVVAGTIPLMYSSIGPVLSFLKAGKLVGIGVASATRIRAIPDVPTFREGGVTNSDVVSWYSLMAPAGTPKSIVQRLNAEVAGIMRNPEIVERLASAGLEASPSTPQVMEEILKADLARWKQIIDVAGIRQSN